MVFDPEKISLIVTGVKVIGYANGSKASAEHNKDAVTPTTGIQGDTVYALNADRPGTIKFTLFGSSASLIRLHHLAQDRAQVAVTLHNANDDGGFIISYQDCRILKVPKLEGGDDDGSIEVSIYVPTMVFRDWWTTGAAPRSCGGVYRNTARRAW